jgi:hypothetical protein
MPEPKTIERIVEKEKIIENTKYIPVVKTQFKIIICEIFHTSSTFYLIRNELLKNRKLTDVTRN